MEERGIENLGADIENDGAGLGGKRSIGMQDLSTIAVKDLELSSSMETTSQSHTDDEEESERNQSCSFVGNRLERFWSYLGDIFSERSALAYTIFYIIIALLYNAYFIASIYYSIHNNVPMDWCDGVGFLIVITGLTYLGLFYFQVVKKFWGEAIYRSVMKPIGKAFDRAWTYASVYSH